MQALGLAGEPFDEAVGVGDLALGLLERLAVLHAPSGRPRPVGVVVDQAGPVAQEGGALVRIRARPVGKGVVRGLDGALGLGGAEVGDMADDLAGRGIVDGDAVRAAVIASPAMKRMLAQELQSGVAGALRCSWSVRPVGEGHGRY